MAEPAQGRGPPSSAAPAPSSKRRRAEQKSETKELEEEADAHPDEPSQKKSSRGRTVTRNRSYNDDQMHVDHGAEGPSEKRDARADLKLEQVLSRTFWESWDTDLLKTWLMDYGVSASIWFTNDREKMLDHLVRERKKYKQPAEGVELQELTKVWQKWNPLLTVGPTPGRYQPDPKPPAEEQPVEGMQVSSEDEEEEKGQEAPAATPPAKPRLGPTELAARFEQAHVAAASAANVTETANAIISRALAAVDATRTASRAAAVRAEKQSIADAAEARRIEQAEFAAFKAAKQRQSTSAAAPLPAYQVPLAMSEQGDDEECAPAAQCNVCAKVAPAHLNTNGPWSCPHCGLRGDIAGSAANSMLIMRGPGAPPRYPSVSPTRHCAA